jgi:hypothetical protein
MFTFVEEHKEWLDVCILSRCQLRSVPGKHPDGFSIPTSLQAMPLLMFVEPFFRISLPYSLCQMPQSQLVALTHRSRVYWSTATATSHFAQGRKEHVHGVLDCRSSDLHVMLTRLEIETFCSSEIQTF